MSVNVSNSKGSRRRRPLHTPLDLRLGHTTATISDDNQRELLILTNTHRANANAWRVYDGFWRLNLQERFTFFRNKE